MSEHLVLGELILLGGITANARQVLAIAGNTLFIGEAVVKHIQDNRLIVE